MIEKAREVGKGGEKKEGMEVVTGGGMELS